MHRNTRHVCRDSSPAQSKKRRDSVRVHPKLMVPMSEASQKRHHAELMAMFELLPKVSAEFGVVKPTISFKWSGERNGHYNWHNQEISISPKPWNGHPMSIFIHEFAHHIQWAMGRTTREWTIENLEYTPEGGHGWSFYEILKLVVEHFEFIHGITYDWSLEYKHIRQFHEIMLQDPGFIPEAKIMAVMNLMGCDRFTARSIIQERS